MTLNGHFALKSGSSSASNGLAYWLSEKTVRKFAELRIYCQRQKARDCTGDIRVMELFNGITEQEATSVKAVNCIYSFTRTVAQFSHCSLMPVKNK